ncbi:MAG: serine hydrolase [Myxococcota bacterium]
MPTLLLHGKHDHLAPESEFAEFVQQMKNVGNDFEFHLFDVGHFFRNRAARNEVTALIDRFLRSRGFLETREERIRKQMSRSNVPGTAVAYVRDCRLTEVLTLGTANSETGAPVQPSTVFEAASLSKPVFALLFLRAVASGYATLDAPFGDAVPNPRIKDSKAYAHVTPRMLLAHRSGLPNWSGPSRDLDRLDPLVFAFPPGDSFAYSGEGYFMLQRQLESLRDTELADLFHAELAPVMPLSSFGAIAAGAPTSHGHGADGLASSGRPLSASPPIAAYSLKTVAADYGRFVAYVCAGADLPDLLFEEMLRPQSPAPADHYGASADALGSGTISWALGWGVQRTYDRAIHFHWGDNGAFKAFAAFDRKSGNGVVYFANGKNSLELVPAIVEPVVGSMKPVRAWLN